MGQNVLKFSIITEQNVPQKNETIKINKNVKWKCKNVKEVSNRTKIKLINPFFVQHKNETLIKKQLFKKTRSLSSTNFESRNRDCNFVDD